MALRQETVTHKQGIPVDIEQLGYVFGTLATFLDANPESLRVLDFVSGIVFELRMGQHEVRRTGDEQGSPFPGLHILVYPIDSEGMYLLHIRDGQSQKRGLEQRVADALGIPCAVSAVVVEIDLPIVNGRFRCDMTPIIDRLRGANLTPVWPTLPGMTGKEAANAVGALLPQAPQGQNIGPKDQSQWFPTWRFGAGDLKVTVELNAGHPPTVKNGITTHHYIVDGSVVTGELPQGEDNQPEDPLLLVKIERSELAGAPHELLLSTDTLRAQAQQVARAFANISMS